MAGWERICLDKGRVKTSSPIIFFFSIFCSTEIVPQKQFCLTALRKEGRQTTRIQKKGTNIKVQKIEANVQLELGMRALAQFALKFTVKKYSKTKKGKRSAENLFVVFEPFDS